MFQKLSVRGTPRKKEGEREMSFTSCSLSTEGGCKTWVVHILRVVEERGACYVREGLQT